LIRAGKAAFSTAHSIPLIVAAALMGMVSIAVFMTFEQAISNRRAHERM